MENSTDNLQGWDTPQRQSPAAIFILLGSTLLSLLKMFWPVLLLVVFRSKPKDDEGYWGERIVILAIVLSCITIVGTIANFLFFRFYIKGNNLIIQSGWIKKKTVTIPLQNIQSVHLEQNLWQRALSVMKLTIDSAGSETNEAKIDALSVKKAEELKLMLLSKVHAGTQQVTEEEAKQKIQSKLSGVDLFKLSLTSNHLEAFFILIGLSLNLIDNLKDVFKIDSWNLMESYAMQVAGQTAIVITILVVGVSLISIVVSIIRTLIKFYNFTLEEIQQGWKISFGLINHQQKIIPSNKIQILSWKANWLRRKINFWIVTVQSIGHSRAKPKEHIQIPVTSLNGVLSLAPMYQQSPVFDVYNGLKIEPAYWTRKALFIGVPITAVITLILYLSIGIAGMAGLLLLVYFFLHYKKSYKVFRWQINDEGLQLYSGVWGRKFTLLTWKKVQQVQIKQSPYQRKHELATIAFYTAGGKVWLPYLKFETAKQLADLSLYYVESREENWM